MSKAKVKVFLFYNPLTNHELSLHLLLSFISILFLLGHAYSREDALEGSAKQTRECPGTKPQAHNPKTPVVFVLMVGCTSRQPLNLCNASSRYSSSIQTFPPKISAPIFGRQV